MADIEKKGRDQKTPPKKDKKPRRSPMRMIKDTISEVKKVTWPSKKDWINHTAVVSAFIVMMMVVVGLIDIGLSSLLGLLVAQ